MRIGLSCTTEVSERARPALLPDMERSCSIRIELRGYGWRWRSSRRTNTWSSRWPASKVLRKLGQQRMGQALDIVLTWARTALKGLRDETRNGVEPYELRRTA